MSVSGYIKDDITVLEQGKKTATRDGSAFTDPESHMIVETYDPVIVTCHQDAMIRFWDAQVSDDLPALLKKMQIFNIGQTFGFCVSE